MHRHTVLLLTHTCDAGKFCMLDGRDFHDAGDFIYLGVREGETGCLGGRLSLNAGGRVESLAYVIFKEMQTLPLLRYSLDSSM